MVSLSISKYFPYSWCFTGFPLGQNSLPFSYPFQMYIWKIIIYLTNFTHNFVMFNHLEIVINSVKSWYFLHFHIKPLKKNSQHPRILKLFQTWKAQNKIILIFPLSKFTIRWKPCNIITSYKHHPSRLAISRLYCLFSSHFLGYIHMFLWPVSSIGRSRHLFPLSE